MYIVAPIAIGREEKREREGEKTRDRARGVGRKRNKERTRRAYEWISSYGGRGAAEITIGFHRTVHPDHIRTVYVQEVKWGKKRERPECFHFRSGLIKRCAYTRYNQANRDLPSLRSWTDTFHIPFIRTFTRVDMSRRDTFNQSKSYREISLCDNYI